MNKIYTYSEFQSITQNQLVTETLWEYFNTADELDKLTSNKRSNVNKSNILKKVKHNGYTYYLTDYMSDDVFLGEIFVFDKEGNFVGENNIVKWRGESDKYLEGSVSVHPDHRRKGIATQMYDMAEEYFNKKFKPSPTNTQDAKKFWKSRKNN